MEIAQYRRLLELEMEERSRHFNTDLGKLLMFGKKNADDKVENGEGKEKSNKEETSSSIKEKNIKEDMNVQAVGSEEKPTVSATKSHSKQVKILTQKHVLKGFVEIESENQNGKFLSLAHTGKSDEKQYMNGWTVNVKQELPEKGGFKQFKVNLPEIVFSPAGNEKNFKVQDLQITSFNPLKFEGNSYFQFCQFKYRFSNHFPKLEVQIGLICQKLILLFQ